MFKIVALVLVLVTISYAFEVPSFSIGLEVEHQRVARQAQRCRPHEKFGCGTEVKCGDPKQKSTNEPCKSGCYCIHGYVRKGDKCVKESECRPKRETPAAFAPDREAKPFSAPDREAKPLVFDGPLTITYQKGHVHVHF